MSDPIEVSGSPLSVGVHVMVVCYFERRPQLDVTDEKKLYSLGSPHAEHQVSGDIRFAIV